MLWTVVFNCIPVLAWAVAVCSALLPMKLGRLPTLLLSLVLGAAFCKFGFFAIVGGDSFNPQLPQQVVLAYGVAYGAAMLLAFFSCIAVCVEFALSIAGRAPGVRARRIRTAVLAVFSAALAAWGVYEGIRVPPVKRVEIAFESLPACFDGYRIVHLSDLHCSPAARKARFERIVDRVNTLDADMIAITGDFVDGTVAERGGDMAPLGRLRARDAVLGCTGNHEAYWEWDRWLPVFRRFGIVFPEETGAVAVHRESGALAVGAVPDPAISASATGDASVWPAGGIDGCFDGTPPDAFRILLFHRPLADSAGVGPGCSGVRLQLSGHTHGGAMPLVRWLVARANEGRVRGLYEFAPGRFIHVSPGTGQWAGFPLRILNPAEITLIVLRKA